MKYHIRITGAVAAIISIIAIGITGFYFKQQDTPEVSCTSRLTYIADGYEQNLLLSFQIDNADGIAILHGSVISDRKTIGAINRRILFSYVKNEGGVYILRARKISSIKGETLTPEEINSVLPPFFTEEDNTILYKIQKIRNGTYLFIIGRIPRFVCTA